MSNHRSTFTAAYAGLGRLVACAMCVGLALVLPAMTPVWADEEPVTSSLEAFTVIQKADGTETFRKADRAQPGGLIEYRIRYQNNTEAPLGAFTVNGAVPNKTAYEGQSQSSDMASTFQAEIADLGWVTVPAYREVTTPEGAVEKVRVPPEEYLNVRWQLTDPLSAGGAVNVTYRVRIDK